MTGANGSEDEGRGGRATEEESSRLRQTRKILKILAFVFFFGLQDFFCLLFFSQLRPQCERCDFSISCEIAILSAEQLGAATQHEEAWLLRRLTGEKEKRND